LKSQRAEDLKIIEANRTSESAALTTIVICVNERFGVSSVSCGGSDSAAIADAMDKELKTRNLVVEIDRIHCLGLCASGPNVRFFPGGDWFTEVSVDDVPEMLNRLEASL
jgi:(2Fe-2S) ferredoxin